MNPVTRRAALVSISAGGFGSLVANTLAGPANVPTLKQEFFVVGPYSLGDWFKKYREEAKSAIVVGAPDDDEIIKSLNECKLFVIDRRRWKSKDKARFERAEGYPQLVAGGKLIHKWKEKGKNCTILVEELKAVLNHTYDDTTPPSRHVILNVTIDIRGENGLVSQHKRCSFDTDREIAYDITGKEIPGKS
jgi:hypothetical protein